jgi:hypothetical protein
LAFFAISGDDDRLRAEIRAGELLRDLGKRRGQTSKKTSRGGSLPSNKELGVTGKQSSRWQQKAAPKKR